ncbi:hypothetical protein D3C77_618860 [compost metagenome]
MDRNRVWLDLALTHTVLTAVGELHQRVTAQQIGKVAVGLGALLDLFGRKLERMGETILLLQSLAGHGSARQLHTVLAQAFSHLDQVAAIDRFIGQPGAVQ